jgi:hypothetical protein
MSESGGKEKSDSKVFDVAKPGESMPTTTSKPVLVSNRPVLKDPMMVDSEGSVPDDPTAIAESKLTAAGRLKISPITPGLTVPDANATETPHDIDSNPIPKPTTGREEAAETAIEQTTSSSKPAEPETIDAQPVDDTAVTDEIDTNDDTAPAKKMNSGTDDEAALAAEVAREKELQELVDSHKYYLPIDQVEKRRAKHYAWAGGLLIILLGLAWADVALDSGIISIPGVKAVTHFFGS